MTIVVTGLGAVTSLGDSAVETFDALVRGERGLRPISLFDPGEVRSRLVAAVGDVDTAARGSRTSSLALRAVREAMAHAGLDVRARRVGLVLGGTTAGMFETESILATLLATAALSRCAPSGEHSAARDEALSKMLEHPLTAPTDHVAGELGPFARVRSISSACSSGANALALGAVWLELGLVDAVVCGGADSLCRVTVSGFSALGALDPEGARPFDVRRRGLTLGEGAGALVLERASDGRSRAICTLLGWSSQSEAHHITNPEATGEAPFMAMRAALSRAGLAPSDVDYVNAHGTGTPLNDAMETRALERVFGADLPRVRVSSQKGMIGHTLAAAGAIEAVVTALAVARGVVPPTGGLEEPDPACRLRHVLAAEHAPVRAALSSSFGFGGMDTALVFGALDRDAPSRARARGVVVTGISTVTPAGIATGLDVADLPRAVDGSDVVIPADALDEVAARRLDRTSRLAAIACGGALAEKAGRSRSEGIVLGNAFGAVDATAEFMGRLHEKGARMVRPADFPSLVPSSPAGYVSIYLGLSGPSLVVADLGVSGECALTQAVELVRAGEVDRICAAAIEERSAIVEDVLSVAFNGGETRGPRREGGAALVLADAEARGEALARLSDVITLGSRATGAEIDAAFGAPPERALVVFGDETGRLRELLAGSSWGSCLRVDCSALGTHEAMGSVAAAIAVARVARGDAKAALFVGAAGARGYAGLVTALDRRS